MRHEVYTPLAPPLVWRHEALTVTTRLVTLDFLHQIFMAAYPLLLSPEQLAQYLPLPRQTLIIEQASAERFAAGHIPQSVWVDFKDFQAKEMDSAGHLPALTQLSAVLSHLGITPQTHIICSDDEGGGWAGRLIWILDCLGHQHYSLLDGGLTAWQQAGLPLSQETYQPEPSKYQAVLANSDCSMTKEQILAELDNPNFIVWDARSQAEYQGSKVLAARGGHIPNAVHYEWTRAMDTQRGLRLRNLDSLRHELAALGIDEHKVVATHCQTHHRSGLTYVIGKLLSLNIKGYPGSWAQWGNDAHTPIMQSI